jgi:hypothetical protein
MVLSSKKNSQRDREISFTSANRNLDIKKFSSHFKSKYSDSRNKESKEDFNSNSENNRH